MLAQSKAIPEELPTAKVPTVFPLSLSLVMLLLIKLRKQRADSGDRFKRCFANSRMLNSFHDNIYSDSIVPEAIISDPNPPRSNFHSVPVIVSMSFGGFPAHNQEGTVSLS
jgi:hypothetical protein